jgi:L-cysteine S-thiosulfotransferase
MRRSTTAVLLVAALAACATGPGESGIDQRAAAVFDQAFEHSGRPDMVARLKQDEAQRVCTQYRNTPPAEMGAALEKTQLATIQYPASGKLMGDWKQGETIAQDGYGMRFTDTDTKRPNGGNCYGCHRLSPQELSFGTLGPSLYQFGKLRGATADIQRYVYGKVYNPQAFVACSNMPRFGHNKVLTPEQITHVVALLLDPESPVNK